VPKLKPQELETRRREIIEAARACFLRNGFHQTTTDEICREASITPGGLYHYFSSKEELIAAVIEYSTENTVRRLREMIQEPDDAHTAFQQVVTFFFENIRDPENENIARLDIEIFAESLMNEALAARSRNTWTLRRRWLEALVERGIEEGLYRSDEVDPRGLSSLFIALFAGLRVAKVLWKDDFDLNGAMRALFLMHAGRLTADMSRVTVPGK
jgi:AcrR family transcriptional regulator